jgi:hypothetical protein
MRQPISKQSSHNIYIVSNDRANRKSFLTELKELFNLYKQKNLIAEFLGDCIGAVSIVVMLYVGLFFVGVFQ